MENRFFCLFIESYNYFLQLKLINVIEDNNPQQVNSLFVILFFWMAYSSLLILMFSIALLNEELPLRCFETTTTVLTWFDFRVDFLLRVSFTLTGETRFSRSHLVTFVSGGLACISDSSLGWDSGWGTMTKSHSLNSQRLWDFFIMIVWIAVESIYMPTQRWTSNKLPTLHTCFLNSVSQFCNPAKNYNFTTFLSCQRYSCPATL